MEDCKKMPFLHENIRRFVNLKKVRKIVFAKQNDCLAIKLKCFTNIEAFQLYILEKHIY